jgi:hypothetical protein
MKFKEFLVRFVQTFLVIVVISVSYVAFSMIFSKTTTSSETRSRTLLPLDTSLKCGGRPAGSGLVYGGNHTRLHSWPWLVALRLKPTNDFFCGGSVISERHVISGESCHQNAGEFFSTSCTFKRERLRTKGFLIFLDFNSTVYSLVTTFDSFHLEFFWN